jgi:hypothetical protein
MRKSLILVLTAIGGSASYAAGITELGKDPSISDPATWRWHVNSILTDQRKETAEFVATIGASSRGDSERYQRYSPLGLPEPRRDRAP